MVVRIITNNPGMWFLHCHIDLHNTNGMAMVINSGSGSHPAAPPGFPRCGNFLYDGSTDGETKSNMFHFPYGYWISRNTLCTLHAFC